MDKPGQQITRAISELESLESSNMLRVSSLYKSKPHGPQDQPDYINAVLELETSLPAFTLLSHMQAIELNHKRVKERHWGPRTLDLDLLFYGQEHIEEENLKVPHPEMKKRNFVLYPLYEIAPELTIENWGRLENLVAQLDSTGLDKLDTNE